MSDIEFELALEAELKELKKLLSAAQEEKEKLEIARNYPNMYEEMVVELDAKMKKYSERFITIKEAIRIYKKVEKL